MRILLAGVSGLVGARLLPALKAAGHEPLRLVRDRSRVSADSAFWDPAKGELDPALVSRCEAVFNLAGDSVAEGRWTEQKKARIRESRVATTGTLARAVAAAERRPQCFINASATGYYGDRGSELLDENSPSGSGDFLSGVCRDWEAATQAAVAAGVRVVTARFGIILSGQGGALKKMLTPFRLGVGGKIGSGNQYMSWIAIDDVIGALLHALHTATLSGPMNVVVPDAVTNAEFTRTLGSVLHRPTLFPMPAFAARLAFGQMADELLLSSQRVVPKKLIESGYHFQYPDLAGALKHVLA